MIDSVHKTKHRITAHKSFTVHTFASTITAKRRPIQTSTISPTPISKDGRLSRTLIIIDPVPSRASLAKVSLSARVHEELSQKMSTFRKDGGYGPPCISPTIRTYLSSSAIIECSALQLRVSMKKKKSQISTTVTPVQFVGEELSIKVLSLTPVSKNCSSWNFWEVLANFAGLRSKSKSKGTAIIPEWFE